MEIKGFKNVNYTELQAVLSEKYKTAAIPDVQIANDIEVRSLSTVKNTFNAGMQSVSDEVLTKVFKVLDLNGFVLWINGERNYYISHKN
jgi:hypothetical protein